MRWRPVFLGLLQLFGLDELADAPLAGTPEP